MTDEEEFLKSAQVRRPPERLNRRMGQLFDGVRAGRGETMRWVRAPLWQAVAAVLAVGIGAWLIRPVPSTVQPPPVPSQTVHYLVVQSPVPYDVFDWTQYPADARPQPRPAPRWIVSPPARAHDDLAGPSHGETESNAGKRPV